MATKAIFPVKGLAPIRRAGRAPGCLLKQLARQLRGLDWLQRTVRGCRWITRTQPQLNRTPLYGTLLQELACATSPAAEPPQKASRIIRRSEGKTAVVEKAPAHERFKDLFREKNRSADSFQRLPSPGKTRQDVPPAVPLNIVQLPATAPEPLIQRLAGNTAAAAKQSHSAPQSSEPPRGATVKRPSSGATQSPASLAEHPVRLRDNLSRRVRRQLLTPPAVSAQARPQPASGKVPPQPPRRVELESQWMAPIEGPQVSFYASVMSATNREAGKPPGPAQPAAGHYEYANDGTAVAARPFAATVDRPATTRHFASQAEPLLRTASAATDSAKVLTRQQNFALNRSEPSLRQLLQQAHSRDGERLLAPYDDPTPFTVEKQAVPSDLSGPEPGQVLLPPGRQSRWQGRETSGRDDLAEQISSILADEARRHGIDV